MQISMKYRQDVLKLVSKTITCFDARCVVVTNTCVYLSQNFKFPHNHDHIIHSEGS